MHHDLPVAAPERGLASDLISALKDRAPRTALALAGGQMAWPAARWLHDRVREQTTYTVRIPATDDLYDGLHEWVLSLLPPDEQRALVAWSSKPRAFYSDITPGDRKLPGGPPALRLRYDGTREQVIVVDGRKISVVVADSTPAEGERWKPPEIVFTARSLAGKNALLTAIAGVLKDGHQKRRRPSFKMLDKFDEWERLDYLPPRDLDSVILPPGQAERLAADVGRWLGAEQEYLRRCIPWHRGHLYEGGPGTGKTSVARAIASHFAMDVWYLPLADVKRDGDLLRVVTQVSPRSMLLLEDADVFHAATRRDDENGATLSGLLNALDGIATPHGLFTVLTSNRPGVLDDAVVRAGRVDLTEHFSLAGPAEAGRLIGRYYDCPPLDAAGISGVAPGDVIEACKRHADPVSALGELAASMGLDAIPN